MESYPGLITRALLQNRPLPTTSRGLRARVSHAKHLPGSPTAPCTTPTLSKNNSEIDVRQQNHSHAQTLCSSYQQQQNFDIPADLFKGFKGMKLSLTSRSSSRRTNSRASQNPSTISCLTASGGELKPVLINQIQKTGIQRTHVSTKSKKIAKQSKSEYLIGRCVKARRKNEESNSTEIAMNNNSKIVVKRSKSNNIVLRKRSHQNKQIEFEAKNDYIVKTQSENTTRNINNFLPQYQQIRDEILTVSDILESLNTLIHPEIEEKEEEKFTYKTKTNEHRKNRQRLPITNSELKLWQLSGDQLKTVAKNKFKNSRRKI